MKSILQKILAYLARATIRKYNPAIVGITGSVGKTSTRTAVFAVLKNKFKARTSEKNYNTEIGLPLAILGISHCGRNVFKWFAALAGIVLGSIILTRHDYPQVLVLEYGIDHPGDMDILLSIAKPHIGIITAIGDVPVHVEFFNDPRDVAEEKSKLIQALPENGVCILNHDDPLVIDMRRKTKAAVLTYGKERHADVRIVSVETRTAKSWSEHSSSAADIPEGLTVKIEHKRRLVPMRLYGGFGMPQAYAAAGAAAAGIAMGMNLVEIGGGLKDYAPPPGRLRLIKGIKSSYILDDTYNAAPEAMRAALDTLKKLPGLRKIAVLGDMLEIGKYTEQVHRAIGSQASEFVDILIAVGPRASFIAQEAVEGGIKKNARLMNRENVLKFNDAREAGKALDKLVRPGDLILVKGSQSMRMEKAVEEIMADPKQAAESLVRQDAYWKKT